ncbi:hypothetical protein BSL78_27252 [Apostichopus japonicus]|uniref:Urease domain-containing protein n=1 Tax=Stichopus japonicus TaxID=307972 RepID=A0A2G8JJJ9_STIJA|nr:hypothetical protein BSL78_27252 [Apostichopus japonicus]
MKLSPREIESLLLHQVGCLAQKRLARGVKLNHPEAVALIGSQVGKLADLVLWSPAFFGAKPEIIVKGGQIAWAQIGDIVS